MRGFVCSDELKTNITYVDSGYCKMLVFEEDIFFLILSIFVLENLFSDTDYHKCNRIFQGVRTMLPYMTGRTVEISPEDMRKILNSENGNCSKDELICDEKFRNITSGSVVLVSEYNGYSIPFIF